MTYILLNFAMIHAVLDLSSDCSMDLWNSFTIEDAIQLIVESSDGIMPETVSACWQALESKAVNDFKSFTIIDEVKVILQVAREIDGEGFSNMIEEVVHQHIEENKEILIDEDLEELQKL